MTIDWAKPITTSDNIPVRVLATDLPGEAPVAVAIKSAVHRYPLSGESTYRTAPKLLNSKTKRSGYIAIGSGTIVTSYCFPTELEARLNFNKRFSGEFATVCKVEWEE